MGLVLWFRDVAAGLKSKLDTFVPTVSGTIQIVTDAEHARVVDEGRVERSRDFSPYPAGRTTSGIGTETFRIVVNWVTENMGMPLRSWEFIDIVQQPAGGHVFRGTAVDEYSVTHSFTVTVFPNGRVNPELSRVL
jgi:hypothetical protein